LPLRRRGAPEDDGLRGHQRPPESQRWDSGPRPRGSRETRSPSVWEAGNGILTPPPPPTGSRSGSGWRGRSSFQGWRA
jgi:hypothetical protein